MARTEEVNLASLLAELNRMQRQIRYFLSVLRSSEDGLEATLGDSEEPADIAVWAHRASVAAEAAAECLGEQASHCRLLSECASGPDPRESSH